MNDISRETLKKIREQGIVPRAKGYFLLKHSTVWTLFGISIVLGSIAGSAVIFQIRSAEWELFHYFQNSIPEFILLFVPYFWGLFMIGFSIIAFYYFRQTQGGYRYRAFTIVALSVLISILGGIGLYAVGVSERMESVFEERLSFYRGVEFHSRMVWMSPDKGLLAGKIVDVSKEGIIILKDLDGKNWSVNASNAIWRGRLSPSPDLEIKLIGTMKGGESFIAREVRPWHGRKKREGKGRHNMNMHQSSPDN